MLYFVLLPLNSNLSYKFGRIIHTNTGTSVTVNASTNFDEMVYTGFYYANFWVAPSGAGVNVPPVSSNNDKMGTFLSFSNYNTSTSVGGVSQLYLGFGGVVLYRGMNGGTWSSWATK